MRRYAILALAVLAFAGWAVLNRDAPTVLVETTEIGRDLPEITVTPLAGGDPRPLSEEIVGVSVINVFASWCAPCRAEHPVLTALNADGVRVVGLAWRDPPLNTQAFLTELGDPYARVMTDAEGEADRALGLDGAIPATFVVSASGEVLLRHHGPLVGTDGEAALAEIRRLTTGR